ncbi:helix-turn-helix domain-containing protein [Streptomyces sp. 021-4]|uniref:helix-turn-helix domain-containing protein n=1 Tax=Streptomyces sp. 021-4 TaxID=2789260 RepID=UPI0039F4FFC3
MTFDPEALGHSRSDLAAALKEQRRRAGWTQVRLAKRCNMSQTKVSNIESGKLTPALVDVELILETLGAEGPLAAEIRLLTRSANTEWQDHGASRRRGLDKKQDELARLEAATREMWLDERHGPGTFTGLFRTPGYFEPVLTA